MKTIFNTLAVLMLIFNGVYASNKWTLRTDFEIQAISLKPVDCNSDGVDEFMITIDNRNFVEDWHGNIIKQITLPNKNYSFVGAVKLEDEKDKKFIFQVTENDTLYLLIYESNKFLEKFSIASRNDNHLPERWDCIVTEVSSADLNKDGFNDLICFLSTSYDLKPRGILVYDCHNAKELWHYWLAGSPSIELNSRFGCMKNVRDNEKNDFVIGTSAPGNGNKENGMTDSLSYVVVIDRTGKIVWKRQIGDLSTVTIALTTDIDRDGESDVIAFEEGGLASNQQPNSLLILDGKTGKTKRYINTGERFLGIEVCDLSRNGRLEIITGNSDGTIRVFNHSLNLEQERHFNTTLRVYAACDFNGDGRTEILVSTRDCRIILLDEHLQTILEEQFAYGISFSATSVNCGRTKKILLTTGDNAPFTNRIVSVIPVVPIINRKPYNFIIMAVPLMVFCALVIVLIYYFRLAARFRRVVNFVSSGLFVIDSDNKITFMNTRAAKMFHKEMEGVYNKPFINICIDDKDRQALGKWLENPEPHKSFTFDIILDGGTMKLEAKKCVLNGKNKVILIEDKTVKYTSDKIVSWAGFAQKLAHEVKNPLSTITLTLQRLQSLYRKELGKGAGKLDAYTDSILEEVDRLRGTTDRFMRFLSIEKPVFELNDINSLIEAASKKYENVLSKGVRIKKSYGKDIPSVRCDSSQIMVLVNNLIENGLKAIGGSGVLSIRSLLVEKVIDGKIGKYIEVSIEDSGVGIAGKDLRNLYKSFYTTKEGGTGLGLLISRQIVELHNGEISIQSKKDIGTTVMVCLPVKESNL